jgi:hypothetical protein
MTCVGQLGQVVVHVQDFTLQFELSRDDTIASIKTLIANQSCIPYDRQTLTFADIPLKDSLTLGDYQILPASHISWAIDLNYAMKSSL